MKTRTEKTAVLTICLAFLFSASGVLFPASRASGSAIVIDHNCADLSKVPTYWIDEAKKLAIHYAHTSHGGQIVEGAQALESTDSTYDLDVVYAGGDDSPPASKPCSDGPLCMYDGNPPETYITPELYWESTDGLATTRSVADQDVFDFSMWSWCGQASYYDQSQIQDYLDTLAQLQDEYPDMRFILMTGHTDGGSMSLAANNDLIRQFAQSRGMVLYDFADIESYDPDGNHYPDTADDCSWCADWCDAHPDDCADIPNDCAHSHGFNCKLKANAFWWMMARLAGWDGSTDNVRRSVQTGDWNSPATWEGGRIPGLSDFAAIGNSSVVTVTRSQVCGALSVGSAGVLVVQSGTLVVGGAIGAA